MSPRQPAEKIPVAAEELPRLARRLAQPMAVAQWEQLLLRRLKARRKRLEGLLAETEASWGIEDGFYRFYHESMKVGRLSGLTEEIVRELRALLPERDLHPWFVQIVADGARNAAEPLASGAAWVAQMRPVVEAGFHAHFFLKLACRYGRDLKSPPAAFPAGWGAVLYLFELR